MHFGVKVYNAWTPSNVPLLKHRKIILFHSADSVLLSLHRYPDNQWEKVGVFHMRNERSIQTYPLDVSTHVYYAKYIKVCECSACDQRYSVLDYAHTITNTLRLTVFLLWRILKHWQDHAVLMDNDLCAVCVANNVCVRDLCFHLSCVCASYIFKFPCWSHL